MIFFRKQSLTFMSKAFALVMSFVLLSSQRVESADTEKWKFDGYTVLDDGGSRVFRFTYKKECYYILTQYRYTTKSLGKISFSATNDFAAFLILTPSSEEERKTLDIIDGARNNSSDEKVETVLSELYSLISKRSGIWPSRWIVVKKAARNVIDNP